VASEITVTFSFILISSSIASYVLIVRRDIYKLISIILQQKLSLTQHDAGQIMAAPRILNHMTSHWKDYSIKKASE